MEGTETDEAKPHYNDLGKPASFECKRCMCTQGLDVPMNLKLALTAVGTLCPAEMAGCFDRCGHVKA